MLLRVSRTDSTTSQRGVFVVRHATEWSAVFGGGRHRSAFATWLTTNTSTIKCYRVTLALAGSARVSSEARNLTIPLKNEIFRSRRSLEMTSTA
jgi:hypothetical protein